VIRTTFDERIQKAAEQGLDYIFENKVKAGSKAQAAIVVMSRDGAVRAIVGGRNLGIAGGFNRATQALRQTGSSFKPFVYATALENGFHYDSIVIDEPYTINVPGSGPYTPKNYTRNFRGPITFTEALTGSVNVAAVKISESIGREKVRGLAQDFGIDNKIAKGPALALGASEATLLEMTGAYAGILNLGVSAKPYGVRSLTIQGDTTPLMGKSRNDSGKRVISQKAAAELIYMMYKVVEEGTGRRAKLEDREAAGKTGTTQGARDAWFIGFTADYVTGIWMGNDNNAKLTGVTGGGLPADIWRETMTRVHSGIAPKPLPMLHPTPAVAAEDLSEQIDRTLSIPQQIGQDIRRAEKEAETIMNAILGIFKRKN
jgi:membrane peptidoglycan carboxypeptidase